MRAAVLRAIGEPLQIEEVELADPGPREVVVAVAAAGLCHSDVRFMEGAYPTKLPAVLGHESAGVVVEVGSEVDYVSPGDHVITSLSVFCGTCDYCVAGDTHQCQNRLSTHRRPGDRPRLSAGGEELYQFLNLSSFAERLLVHENSVVKIRSDIPLDRAALLGCGVATGLGAVFNTAGVAPGETVVVIGCGGVGLGAVQGARIAGANQIVAVDRVPEKLDLAALLGATAVIDASRSEVKEQVMALTGGRGVDHALEAIGTPATAELAFSLLRPGGTATVVGLIPVGDMVSIPGSALVDEKTLQGSNMGSNRFRVDVPRYVEMYMDGRLNLDDLVSERISLDQINEGFEAMRTGRGARRVVVFEL